MRCRHPTGPTRYGRPRWRRRRPHSSGFVIMDATTGAASALGTTGFKANGRVHPHGLYTHRYFDYGTDSTYGQRTEPEPLPARRAAYYAETRSLSSRRNKHRVKPNRA